MSEQQMTFARLIAPMGVDEFFDQYYEKKPVHIKGAADKASDVCNWDDFNELVARTGIWSDQTFKMVIDTERVPPQGYCERAPGRDGMMVMVPSSPKVQKQMDAGASIVLDLIETLTPGIRSVTEALEMALATRVSCNAYCSQNQRRAFPSHFDSMEVFALHIEGEKVWRVYEGRFEDPLEMPGYDHTSFAPDYHERAKGELMMEVHMKPGDLLYLPKGWYHDALASSDACLHLSFSTAQTTGLNFINWLARGLDEEPLFRKPMPPHDDVAAHTAHINALKETLAEIMGREDIHAQFREEQRSKAFGGLSNVVIAGASPRFRVKGRGVKLVRRGKEFQIAAPGGKGAVPEGGEDAINWVLERDHFSHADLAKALPDMGEQKMLEVTQALASVGVLEAL